MSPAEAQRAALLERAGAAARGARRRVARPGEPEYSDIEYGAPPYADAQYGDIEYGDIEYGDIEYGRVDYEAPDYGKEYEGPGYERRGRRKASPRHLPPRHVAPRRVARHGGEPGQRPPLHRAPSPAAPSPAAPGPVTSSFVPNPVAHSSGVPGPARSRGALSDQEAPGRPGSRRPGSGRAVPGPERGPENEVAERHLRLVPRPRWFAAYRRRVLVGLVIAGVTAMCFALVTLHVLIAENQFTLDRLQQEANNQQESYEKLRLHVAQLEAPARIVSLAEGNLGMVQPASVTYLPAISVSTQEPGAVTAGPQGSGPNAQGPAARNSNPAASVTAPSGDADWPGIKPYLSGNP